MSVATVAVLRAFASEPQRERYGYELSQDASLFAGAGNGGLPTGLLYPLLHRLETAGYLSSRWQGVPATHKPRRLYKITDVGLRRAQEFLGAGRDGGDAAASVGAAPASPSTPD